MIYPLTVAAKSQSTVRRDAADMILSNLKEHSSALVQQAVMVSEELIRVAILWHKQWHEALEEASRLYFGEHNVQKNFWCQCVLTKTLGKIRHKNMLFQKERF